MATAAVHGSMAGNFLQELNVEQCQGNIFKSKSKSDMLLSMLYITMDASYLAFQWFYEFSTVLFSAVILILVLYVIYKSYWSPVLYVKESTEIGFSHIDGGPHRELRIARAQASRKFGTKVPPPYPNGWYAVVESRELKVGGVKSVDVLGQNLCVYRGEDGVARCVDAYCPHLGANLGIGGTVCGNCIECPFHKWKFDSGGVCVSVPDSETVPKGVSIKTWTTREIDGAVWIWYDAEKREPLWQVPESLELKSWAYRGRNEFMVCSHVQDIPENGADVSHLNAVHSPSLLTKLGEKYPVLINLVGRHVWSAEWSRGQEHESRMRLKHDYKVGKMAFFHFDVVATQMGPGHVRLLVQSVFGPLLICQSVTPVAPLLQRVIHRIYSPWYNAPFAAGFVTGESIMFERDIAIWNSKRYVNSPTYVKLDKSIRAFRSWYSQFYSENSVSFKDAVTNPLEW